jgi:hypothetical protein
VLGQPSKTSGNGSGLPEKSIQSIVVILTKLSASLGEK